MTVKEIIRHYSDMVERGTSDGDLTPRQRRLAAVMLNLASNSGYAEIVYPPSDATRDEIVQYLAGIVWDARPLVQAVSPASDDAFAIAHERTVKILRNI